jgi:D-alanyl-D-alanine carboxypeptidase/D-alanyl-D-alanine-endopeptidase (penicillin-binding protein 4)
MPRHVSAILLALTLSAPPAAAQRTAEGTLDARLRQLLDQPPFERALWGVAIADPSGRIVFERNGERLFVPASNLKLVVAAAATLLLPSDFRFRTGVYAAGPLADGVLRGDLVLYGRGDPTLTAQAFEALADMLRARGLTRIEGDLVADASYFDSLPTHPSWEVEDLTWWFAAPVTALGFNGNAVELRIAPGAVGEPPAMSVEPDLGVVRVVNRARTVPVDSPRTLDIHRSGLADLVWADGDVPADARPWTEGVAVADGPAWTALAFRRALESRGIVATGPNRVVYDSTAYAAARNAPPLAEWTSPQLSDILETLLQVSHNWYAELLLKTLGRVGRGRGRGTWEAGLAVERRILTDSLRLDSTSFRLADGSGLSHWNLMSPRAIVALLRGMRARARARSFVDAIPVAGRLFEHEHGTGKIHGTLAVAVLTAAQTLITEVLLTTYW